MTRITPLSALLCCLALAACNTEQITDPLLSSDPMVCADGSSRRADVSPVDSVQKSGLIPVSTVVTKQQQYQLSLALALPSDGIPLNDYFDLVVDVLNPVGQPLPYPVELELDAGMRAHSHGMNTLPGIKPLGGGRFLVEQMLFHMPGEWNLTFKVKRGLMGDAADIDLEVWP